MVKLLRLSLVSLLLAAVTAAPAAASCVASSDAERLHRADAVFVGIVLGVRPSDGSATFRITRVEKGRLLRGAVTRVLPVPFRSSVTIGWTPERGQRWKLYVTRSSGRWTTNDCQGSRRL